jgi:predicted dithiol-disulfide oxidoreductase (DUF899 family)
MTEHRIASKEEWLSDRLDLLKKEKEFTRLRDQLSRQRRELPWEKVDKDYTFETESGVQSLGDLFDGRSQLIVSHFMFGADWEQGCPSCSFWADTYNNVGSHLNQRDISMVVVSKTALDKLLAYRKRMGWTFNWVSSLESNFNNDYQVSFNPEEIEEGEVYYNYHNTTFPVTEAPGMSVFYKDEDGSIYHTYSCYARGLDILNNAYHLMDITPLGRDENDLPFPMAWVKRHDEY